MYVHVVWLLLPPSIFDSRILPPLTMKGNHLSQAVTTTTDRWKNMHHMLCRIQRPHPNKSKNTHNAYNTHIHVHTTTNTHTCAYYYQIHVHVQYMYVTHSSTERWRYRPRNVVHVWYAAIVSRVSWCTWTPRAIWWGAHRGLWVRGKCGRGRSPRRLYRALHGIGCGSSYIHPIWELHSGNKREGEGIHVYMYPFTYIYVYAKYILHECMHDVHESAAKYKH